MVSSACTNLFTFTIMRGTLAESHSYITDNKRQTPNKCGIMRLLKQQLDISGNALIAFLLKSYEKIDTYVCTVIMKLYS